MARRSAEDRREEIVGIAFRHFGEGGYHGTSTEAIAREAGHLPAVPVPPVQDQARALPGLRGPLLRPGHGRLPRGRGGAVDEERLMAMGHAYEDRLLPEPARAAVPDAGLLDQRARDPRLRARGLPRAGPERGRARGCTTRTRRGTSSPTGCCSTCWPCWTSTGCPSGDLPPPAGDRAGARWCSWWSRPCFALPVFGELGNENDFDDPGAEAVAARVAVNDATGAQASPSLIALVRLGADADSARGAGADRARGGGAARSGRGLGRRLRARRRPPAGLARRPLDLPAGDVQERPGGGAAADRGRARRRCRG